MQEIKPKFRPDIRRHWYAEQQGGRSIVLEDPVSSKFFRISPYEFELLRIFDGTLTVSEAIERLKLRGRYFTSNYAAKLVEQFSRAGLLLGTSYGTAKVQTIFRNKILREARQRSLFKLYYLFIPLLKPDRFLDKTLPIWRLLVNRFTAAIVFILIPGALYLLVSGLTRLQEEFLFFFNLQNLLALWIAIAFVKLVHEFSHAYVAKSHGLRVPEMGIGFLIFFPCLYCNTTAAWQLADRRSRMSIALAGILSELVVAILAVYVWYFSKPGLINSVAFYLMAISLASSILFNGNPLLKFDGYFVLTDLLRMPNLQARAFNQLRYLFLDRVLGIEAVAGDRGAPSRRLLLTFYGISAFAYRVFVVTAITAGVYMRFDKSIGALMGGMAFSLFIVRPIVRTSINLVARRSQIRWRPKGVLTAAALVALLAFVVTRPWASNSVYPCFLESAQIREIAIPAEAPVEEVFVRQGDIVNKDGLVLKLNRTPLEHALKQKEADRILVKKEISIIENSEKDLSRLESKYIELAQAEDAINEIREDLLRTDWRAPFWGAVTKLSPECQPGFKPGKGTVVGQFAALGECQVVGIVPETDVTLLQVGARVDVWFPVENGKVFQATVKELSPFQAVDLEGSPFSSRFGGEIATEMREGIGKDRPLEPQYTCKMEFSPTAAIPLGMTGRIVVKQPPKSALERFTKAAFQVFHREIIF
jgi:putative peptide zinc metalloprotease protein